DLKLLGEVSLQDLREGLLAFRFITADDGQIRLGRDIRHFLGADLAVAVVERLGFVAIEQLVHRPGPRGRVRLHFLPPYCPNDNKIERVWEDLHANVTRNHTGPNMDRLMNEVREHLWARNRSLLLVSLFRRDVA